VATISRLLKIIGLFGRISFLLYGSFAKETYHLKEPTNRSHPILVIWVAIWGGHPRLWVGGARVYIYTYLYTCIYIYLYTYIWVYIYIRIYTYSQVNVFCSVCMRGPSGCI